MKLDEKQINDYLTRKFGSTTGNESVRRALMDGYNFAKKERVVWQCSPNENPYVDEHVPDEGKMDAETRELAKQLFVGKMYAGHLQAEHAMKQAIQNAKDFIQILNEE